MAKEDISVQATVFNILNKISIDLFFLVLIVSQSLQAKPTLHPVFLFIFRGFPLSIVCKQ